MIFVGLRPLRKPFTCETEASREPLVKIAEERRRCRISTLGEKAAMKRDRREIDRFRGRV